MTDSADFEANLAGLGLVLPPFKQFGDELYERWGRFFDVAAMGAGIGVQVCEQDQYFNSVKAEIDLVFLPGQKCPAEAMARRGFEQEVFGVATKIGQLFCEGEQEGMGGTSCTSPARSSSRPSRSRQQRRMVCGATDCSRCSAVVTV